MIDNESKPVHRAIAKISFAGLAAALQLPSRVSIVRLCQTNDDALRDCLIMMEGPDFPPARSNERISEVSIIYRTEQIPRFDGFGK